MPLTGNLREFDLASLIQFISGKLETGTLIIQRSYRKGNIYFRNGRVIHAQAGNILGMDAFFELFTWNEGNFEFQSGNLPDIPTTIDFSPEGLILEAARVVDEWQEKKKQLKSLTCVPYFVNPEYTIPSAVQVLLLRKKPEAMTYEEKERLILANIDGKRDFATIARMSGVVTLMAINVVLENIASGRLALRDLVDLQEIVPVLSGSISSSHLPIQKMVKAIDGKRNLEEILLEIEEERGKIIPEFVSLVKARRIKLLKGSEYLNRLEQERLY
ncbi:MAG: DUF4388 domain-containing protein [Dictyoglomaceae bacterium]